ncbi:GNAT family N-acetyltransferase [Streptomyces sp. NPDC127068]|uniref:GNAT family N-acetyltransferase n=1 Tax=Streptomyces sp. NPDC127068 TaxID=3347127 RepID=UPI00365412E4
MGKCCSTFPEAPWATASAPHRGQRLALRAAQLLTEYAHQTLALPRVLLEIEADNAAGLSIARALDFRPTNDETEQVDGKGRAFVLHVWAHDAPVPR